MIAHARGLQGRTAMSSEDSKPTLYERLGGVYSIATVVDDFIDRVMRNPILNANSAVDEAHHRVSRGGLQILRNRNGLLGHRWPPEVHRPLHERISQTSQDHRE